VGTQGGRGGGEPRASETRMPEIKDRGETGIVPFPGEGKKQTTRDGGRFSGRGE